MITNFLKKFRWIFRALFVAYVYIKYRDFKRNKNSYFDKEWYANEYKINKRFSLLHYFFIGIYNNYKVNMYTDNEDFKNHKLAMAYNYILQTIFSRMSTKFNENIDDILSAKKANITSVNEVKFSNAIIIAVYNNEVYTKKLLDSIQQFVNLQNSTVFLVDDGSTELNYEEFVYDYSWVNYKRNVKNLGYLKTINNTIDSLTIENYDYITLLNNDVEIFYDVFSSLIEILKEQKDAACIAPTYVNEFGKIIESGAYINSDGVAGQHEKGLLFLDMSRDTTLKRVDYVSAACVIIKSEKVDLTQTFFDENFMPAYYEDADLCCRFREKGFEVLNSRTDFVVHRESSSYGNLEMKNELMSKNKEIFQKKWQENQIFKKSDMGIPQKKQKLIFWFDHDLPKKSSDGGSTRVLRIAEQLKKLGCEVVFIPVLNTKTNVFDRKIISDLAYHFQEYDNRIYETIKSEVEKNSQIYCIMSRRDVAMKVYPALFGKFANDLKYIYDLVDFQGEREFQHREIDYPNQQKIEEFMRFEQFLIETTDESWFVNRDFSKIDEVLRKHKKIIVISGINKIDPDYSLSSENNLLFIGSFDHPPNVEAIELYRKKVFPQLQLMNFTGKLIIVGKGMEKILDKYSHDLIFIKGIEVKGQINNLDEIKGQFALGIAPLISGSGIKFKLFDYLSLGVATIGTDILFQGIDETLGFSIDDIANQILAHIKNPELRIKTFERQKHKIMEYIDADDYKKSLTNSIIFNDDISKVAALEGNFPQLKNDSHPF